MIAYRGMTFVLPRSKGLLDDLAAARATAVAGLRASAHPSGPYVVLTSHSAAADRLVRQLVERYGEVRWCDGRWLVRRPQLRLPGI